MAENRTGLDSFHGLLGDVQKLWKWIVVAGSGPFIAKFLGVAPPWPAALPFITAAFMLVAIVLVYQIYKRSSRKTVNKVLIRFSVLLVAAFFLYLAIYSEFTFDVPLPNGSSVVRIKGFVCNDVALTVHEKSCPWLGERELSGAEWTPENLWRSWSITVVRLMLVLTWLTTFMSLSAVLACFANFQKRTAA
ncbi:hypothetical protein [Reyranella soli]|uniref:hypothetical protein n=1 Tax=Reyranella soli TaxID=1230389 RepID=UPI0011BE5A16|nr:hypothetical protein [Reyranella soli]